MAHSDGRRPSSSRSEPEVPLVLQDPLSIIALRATGTESIALRSVLERFNYRVEIHWIGSRRQFMEILSGNIPTSRYVVLSAHGDDTGILVPEEPSVCARHLSGAVSLPGRVFVSLACGTGTEAFAEAFLEGGCEAYVAASGEVGGSSTLLFAIHLFYFLSHGHRRLLADAVEEARGHDRDCALFKLYSK